MNVTKPAFFIQHQVEAADFSDAETNLDSIDNIDQALNAFNKAAGHRRLIAVTLDFFTDKPVGQGVELKRV